MFKRIMPLFCWNGNEVHAHLSWWRCVTCGRSVLLLEHVCCLCAVMAEMGWLYLTFRVHYDVSFPLTGWLDLSDVCITGGTCGVHKDTT